MLSLKSENLQPKLHYLLKGCSKKGWTGEQLNPYSSSTEVTDLIWSQDSEGSYHLLSCICVCCFSGHEVNEGLESDGSLPIGVNQRHDSGKLSFTLSQNPKQRKMVTIIPTSSQPSLSGTSWNHWLQRLQSIFLTWEHQHQSQRNLHLKCPPHFCKKACAFRRCIHCPKYIICTIQLTVSILSPSHPPTMPV